MEQRTKWGTPEHSEKMRTCVTRKPLSDETKQKMREAKLGVPKSEEHKRNISAGLKARIAADPAFYERLVTLRKGQPVSEETRQKMSRAHKGRRYSAETIAKMSAAKKGKVKSQETKEKMSASMVEVWARRKTRQ